MSQENQFKVSLVPMTSIDDSLTNLQTIIKAIESVPPDTRLVCFPENSLYLNLDKSPIPKEAALSFESPEIQELSELAKARNINLHMGGVPWLIDGKVYNEALLIRDTGEVVETYEKMHLFDVNLGPGIAVAESKSYNPGDRLNVFTIDGWKFATCICYDLRFAEIFLEYTEQYGVDVFLVPAAFTTKTGEIHWKALNVARAIECQTFVLAAAQVGYHRDSQRSKLRKSWGQSLAVDPWGRTLAESDSYRAFVDSTPSQHEPMNVILDREKILEYRKSIPVQKHRRFRWELSKK